MFVRMLIVAFCLVGVAKAEPPPLAFGRPHVCMSDYPPEAVAAHHEGTVTLAFTITDTGTVADPKVASSSGYAELDAAALACVQDWRYHPAMQNGQPIAVTWKAQVKWSIPTDAEIQLHQTILQTLDALDREASRCLYASDAAKIAPAEFDGMTQVSIQLPASGDAQVSIVASSGNAALDEMATACFRNAPSLKPLHVYVTDGRQYRMNVPWKSVLHPPPAQR